MEAHPAPAETQKPSPKAAAARPAAKAAAKAAPAKAPPPSEEPAAAPEGAPEAAPASAEAPEAAPKTEPAKKAGDVPAKKPRQQITCVIGVSISAARCSTHLKQHLGDADTEKALKELRQQLKAAREAAKGKEGARAAALEARVATLKETIAEKTKAVVRISSGTPVATAVIMDAMVKELIAYGMDQAIAGDRKIVEVSHLHDGAPQHLLYYPLYDRLPCYKNYNAAHEEELRKKRAAANKAAKEKREAGRAAEDKRGARAKGRPAPQGEDEEEEDVDGSKTTFQTYIENALKAVKGNELYRAMRVSNRMREYLSTFVAECLERIAMLARTLVQEVAVVRTMNAEHIKATVHVLLADSGRTPEQIADAKSQIDQKLELYHEHIKSEREKKAAGLGEAQKAEAERKRLEGELARKKKQADLARKRAGEASSKAAELAAEAQKLEPLVAAQAPRGAGAAHGAEAHGVEAAETGHAEELLGF